jgi:hypothetical protein
MALILMGAARAETIIVAATDGAPLPPGSRLEPGQMIALADGERLTLLSQSGALQVIKGPFEGVPALDGDAPPDGAKDDHLSAVAALVGFPDARSDVMGATRRTDGAFTVPPGIWHVSVDSAGPRCIAPGAVRLWRRAADAEATISVRSAAGRLSDVTWPAGDAVFALPEEFATPGRLVVSVDGDLRDLTLAVAPDGLASAPAGQVLSWLMDNKCQRQALTLIQRVHAGLGPENN